MLRTGAEDGFTLIELMVVVLIIGALIAIGLPTFLGARVKAQDKAAASDLANGVMTVKTYFADGDSYAGFDTNCAANAACTAASAPMQNEPSLVWYGAGDPAGTSKRLSIEVATATKMLLTRRSDSGTYLCAVDDGTGTGVHQGSTYASVDTVAECAALPLA